MKTAWGLTFILLALPAFATNKPKPPKPQPAPQGQKQEQGQHQSQQQTAKGGSADASAAAAGVGKASADSASRSASDSDSSASADGVQSIQQTYTDVAQVPMLYQGSLLVSDCGAGVNAAGADNGGAGMFGIVWTTGGCYAFKSGSNFVGIGDIESACVLWYDLNRKAFKRQNYKPDCHAQAVRVYDEHQQRIALATRPEPVVIQSGGTGVTREEMNAAIGAAFKQSQAK